MTFFDRIRNTATGVPIPDVSQLPEVGRLLVALHSLLEKLAEVRHHITDGGGGGEQARGQRAQQGAGFHELLLG